MPTFLCAWVRLLLCSAGGCGTSDERHEPRIRVIPNGTYLSMSRTHTHTQEPELELELELELDQSWGQELDRSRSSNRSRHGCYNYKPGQADQAGQGRAATQRALGIYLPT
ncbi:hypothetical protein LY76DRAFT_594700 [Colletotrichum caudatum]|nr:hypothetical protein LY76DRAFT_594700 [Colletotrichum caudatum]